jgi:hypothetical protein
VNLEEFRAASEAAYLPSAMVLLSLGKDLDKMSLPIVLRHMIYKLVRGFYA